MPSRKMPKANAIWSINYLGVLSLCLFLLRKNPTIYDKNTRNPKSTRIERNVFELFWGLAWVVV